MAVVNFSVENQKGRVVDQGGNDGLWIGPWGVLVEVLGQLVETFFVAKVEFENVALVELLLEVENKVLDGLRNVAALKKTVRSGKTKSQTIDLLTARVCCSLLNTSCCLASWVSS